MEEDLEILDDCGTQIIYNEDSSIRIDKYLAEKIPDLTRSYIQKLILDEQILVNDQTIKANYKVAKNDTITLFTVKPKVLEVVAQDIPIEIIYEDDQLLVVNKPVGMVVHPAPGNYTGTLVNAIMFHCKNRLSSINGVARPGIVHRIDKDTSGLLMICKTDLAHNSIASQLKDHSIKREYVGIVYNNLKDEEGTIDAPIGRGEKDRTRMAINYKNGKNAVTHYRVLERFHNNRYTYVSFRLETGRTHQIRVHMAMNGNPLVGDPLYGPKNAAYSENGQLLHAKTIGFIHPTTNQYMEFNVDPPLKFMSILENLR
jgi:23S rRNA pseudouridine1911/1915/1917 synthase